ncbi:hypothetical protein [Breoghania sp.]|uniref:hypothetical protein n=1 Tax=Breoghania sp. TaxID=2065378 RepID=UPI00261D04E4|nr:hypothetical protein [Breoghania sp.]MDJ0929557.1 hypothetical protein [Breoghania sp.]
MRDETSGTRVSARMPGRLLEETGESFGGEDRKLGRALLSLKIWPRKSGLENLAPPAGFEPATDSLEGRSYLNNINNFTEFFSTENAGFRAKV